MTSGHAKARGVAQAITAVFNVVLSIILISHFSWHGAVIATYTSELMLAAFFGFWIHRQLRITSAPTTLV
jgi:O-antigen/teichoic acid export membrane protein